MNEAADFEIDVDGERFAVHRPTASGGGYDLEWVTDPNPGYGFSIGAPVGYSAGELTDAAEPPEVDLIAQARQFLAMIDPATGYIAD